MASGFDVESAVAAFALDVERSTLELPAMGADGRKLAKAVVDRFPELCCKTFGLGADRCLHVFKDVSGSPIQKGVSVKNTFIDDWIAGGSAKDEEGATCRSLPPQLPKSSVVAAAESSQGAPMLPGMPQKCADLGPPLTKLDKQLDLSPIREGTARSPKDQSGSDWQMPTLLSGGQVRAEVRNTFIHINPFADIDDDVDEGSNDRNMQSMPHDMFRRCLDEELAATVAAHGPSAPPPAAPCQAGQSFVPGMLVMIQGLTKLPAFNGKSGIVESYDAETGRYSVALASPVPACPRRAKVKADNLKTQASFLSVPPPPAFKPTLDDGAAYPQAMPEIPATPEWSHRYAGAPMMLRGGL